MEVNNIKLNELELLQIFNLLTDPFSIKKIEENTELSPRRLRYDNLDTHSVKVTYLDFECELMKIQEEPVVVIEPILVENRPILYVSTICLLLNQASLLPDNIKMHHRKLINS